MADSRASTVRAAALRSNALRLRKGLLYRIEIRRVRRQVQERCARLADGLAHPLNFVRRKIIEHNHVARAKTWTQKRVGIGAEGCAIQGTINDHGRRQTTQAKSTHPWGGLPMAVWHRCPAALAARRASVPPGHLRVGSGLVNEDELLWVKMRLLGDPGLPLGRLRHHGPVHGQVPSFFERDAMSPQELVDGADGEGLATLAEKALSEFGQGDVGCLL